VTTLYGIHVPSGNPQTVHYDDGTGDKLPVPLGTTAFVSGRTMFDILPPDLKSLAVRSKVKYSPHPYVWMSSAHAMPTGLGIESEGLERPEADLPAFEESKIKVYPVVRTIYDYNILNSPSLIYLSSCGRIRVQANSIYKSTRAGSWNSSSPLSQQVPSVKALSIPTELISPI
jgi:Taurine catabolism dioxygenase TauD, TfdA family